MKDTFTRRLVYYLKDRHGKIIKNARTRDNDYNYRRRFSVADEKTTINFILPLDEGSNIAMIFFTNSECRPTSLLVELNIVNGDYSFSGIPRNKLEIKNLYAYAESYLEDIRYLANNALDFIMKLE